MIALTILQWIFSIVSLVVTISFVCWPLLFSMSEFSKIPNIDFDQEKRVEYDNKFIGWIFNDLFRFLLPSVAITIISGIILLVLIGLLSFVILVISCMV
jgi:hypothetical protein